MSRPTGQLEKSLAALTIAIREGADERQRALADGHMGEHVQQVQVGLSGQAGNGWGYVDKDIGFLMPFLYAPAQRQVPFDVPHFTHGIEFKLTPSALVVITAHVVSWHRSEENWITGARVRFAVGAPSEQGTTTIPFTAMAHLSFQGYATYAEGEEFDQ